MKAKLAISLFVLGLLTLSTLAYWQGKRWLIQSVPLESPVKITLSQGMPLGTLADELKAQKLITSKNLFVWYIKLTKIFPQFQAGTYRFETQVSPADIMSTMMQGKIYQELIFSVTIPEGFSLKQIIERLETYPIEQKNELKKLAFDPSFAASLRLKTKNLEGYFYPVTYHFYNKAPTAREVLTKGVEEFFARLPLHYEQDLAKVNLTLEQAVIFASLIEKETSLDEEKPLVSEVIWRRLKDRIPLGIDATIIYGIKDYKGDLKTIHLKDRTNPYNSRIHKGLPPTPIASPDARSLEAVIYPSDQGYYYYVLSAYGQKTHIFSKTLSEHNENVRKFLKTGSH